MANTDFETLGQFYLGKRYDPDLRQRTDDLVLYDSKDLVTHAVCVGMTGSGKTGLCLGLIEEAAIDGVPAIVIDPKGDLANLLLTFPELRASDFRPWINEEDAKKKGVDPDTFAQQQADLWKKGLASWGQDGARITRLKNAADVAVYTPGSAAGLSVNVLGSFAPPAALVMDDAELFRERVSGVATSVLGLVGKGDGPQSREHILVSAVLTHAWTRGESLDLTGLIHAIQSPPVTKLGVMELESVFPAKDRFELAMAVNTLAASPGFDAWTKGEPLDIAGMLRTPEGRPRVSIFSIAHLPDAERMFFVSMLLNTIVTWVRTQSGTSSLRALVYMDEIAGYFPPVANPPSKQPMLTLMKQARAFGVGVVLATQNPVDLDYKGLANAGTWMLGRLQTDRDKQRVLDGLEGAAGSAGAVFDRGEMDRLLSGLGPRVFLMNNIHEDAPVVFETRWCLSYLRGPLTRAQLKTLTDTRRSAAESGTGTPAVAPTPTRVAADSGRVMPAAPGASGRPVLPSEIPQYFIPARGTPASYAPMLLGFARVHYQDAKTGVEAECAVARLAAFGAGPVAVDWAHAQDTDLTEKDIEPSPAAGVSAFSALPADAAKAHSYDGWKKSLADDLFRSHTLSLRRSAAAKLVSAPDEGEREFRARVDLALREQRDAEAEKLRARYAPKLQTLQDRLRRAEQQVAVQKEQASGAKIGTALSIGAAVLGAFMGRKIAGAGTIGRASTAARGATRSMKESSDVGRAEENAEAVRAQLKAIEDEFQTELTSVQSAGPGAGDIETIALKPKKTNITVRAVVLAWAPMDTGGNPAW